MQDPVISKQRQQINATAERMDKCTLGEEPKLSRTAQRSKKKKEKRQQTELELQELREANAYMQEQMRALASTVETLRMEGASAPAARLEADWEQGII